MSDLLWVVNSWSVDVVFKTLQTLSLLTQSAADWLQPLFQLNWAEQLHISIFIHVL